MDVKIISLVFLVSIVTLSHGWSGHVCHHRVSYYVHRTYCRSWFGWWCWPWRRYNVYNWISCWSWRTYSELKYKSVPNCCSGWKGTDSDSTNCITAICRPNCHNGGRCDRPGHCVCTAGHDGDRCDGLTCSHLTACYPGVCVRGSGGQSTSCSCDQGFEGSQCIKMTREIAPAINSIQSRMSFWMRGVGNTSEQYGLLADSTNKNWTDFIWTNMKRFNWINVTTSSQYTGEDRPSKPRWIREAKFGIIEAKVNILLVKESFLDPSKKYVSKNHTVSCNRTFTSVDIGPRSPAPDELKCHMSLPNFDRSLENGDRLTVVFKAKSGGYRDIVYTDRTNQLFRTDYYEGQWSEKSAEFRFDRAKPEHCQLTDNPPCTDTDDIFSVDNDIHVTDTPIALNWRGWNDILSGMFRYAWEVFKLVPDINGNLHERYPLKPLKIAEVMHKNLIDHLPSYKPAEVGMYSFILQAADLANNSRYVRRFCFYDPSSQITLNNPALIIASARGVDKDVWTSNISNPLIVSWKNHFVNKIHEDNKLLNEVKAYPQQLEKGKKSIDQDDKYGVRTVHAIDNSHGIVRFQITHAMDSNGGEGQTEPTSGWHNVSGLTQSSSVNPTNPSRGDTVTIWVRAFDITGRHKTDKVLVHFDDSKPNALEKVIFKKNSPGTYPFGSKVTLGMSDPQSGIYQVKMTIVQLKSSSDMMTHSYTIPTIPESECQDKLQDACFCSTHKKDMCQKNEQILDVNNCWLMVGKEGMETKTVQLRFEIFNNAELSVTRTVNVSDLLTLNGTTAFLGPMHIRSERVSENGGRIKWDHAPACYDRTDMWISYQNKDGKLIKKKLHKDAEYEDLTGLEPGTNYTIQLTTQYGDVTSDPVTFFLITEPDSHPGTSGLTGGAVGGIAVGLILLIVLVLLLVGFLLWRTGRLPWQRRKQYEEADHVTIHNSVANTRVKNSKQNEQKPVRTTAISNKAYSPTDDIYLYGSMEVLPAWRIYHNDLVLLEVIHTGRFAKIYTATWQTAPKGGSNVIAKVIKDVNTEDASLTMLAKINFAANQVGEHQNILRFLGGVVDSSELGPVMVLEYCENGQLDQWLIKQRGNMTDDTIEAMQRMSMEIAQAMAYLTSREIVHKKLAARNVLLTSLLQTKITGFGPTRGEGPDQENNAKADRIPVKWTAPECHHSLKDADEKSDVWSYGIVLWELFSLGEIPYPDVRSRDIDGKLKTGYRLGRPELCEDVHYNLMKDCWAYKPEKRPEFKAIVVKMEAMFGMRPSSDQFYYYEK